MEGTIAIIFNFDDSIGVTAITDMTFILGEKNSVLLRILTEH